MAKATEQMRKLAMETAKELHREAVMLTPVGPDEWYGEPRLPGTLRGNTRLQLNKPESRTFAPDASGVDPISDGAYHLQALKLGDDIVISNNTPYANYIEFGLYKFLNPVRSNAKGFSTQAPAGVFRVTAANFQTVVKKQAAKVAK